MSSGLERGRHWVPKAIVGVHVPEEVGAGRDRVAVQLMRAAEEGCLRLGRLGQNAQREGRVGDLFEGFAGRSGEDAKREGARGLASGNMLCSQ